MNLPALFVALSDYAYRRGARSIKDLPGCWEADLPRGWWMAVNGHGKTIRCSRRVKVPPYSVYLEFNGWPAGEVGANGGWIAAGSIANEDALLTLLQVHNKQCAPSVY